MSAARPQNQDVGTSFRIISSSLRRSRASADCATRVESNNRRAAGTGLRPSERANPSTASVPSDVRRGSKCQLIADRTLLPLPAAVPFDQAYSSAVRSSGSRHASGGAEATTESEPDNSLARIVLASSRAPICEEITCAVDAQSAALVSSATNAAETRILVGTTFAKHRTNPKIRRHGSGVQGDGDQGR